MTTPAPYIPTGSARAPRPSGAGADTPVEAANRLVQRILRTPSAAREYLHGSAPLSSTKTWQVLQDARITTASNTQDANLDAVTSWAIIAAADEQLATRLIARALSQTPVDMDALRLGVRIAMRQGILSNARARLMPTRSGDSNTWRTPVEPDDVCDQDDHTLGMPAPRADMQGKEANLVPVSAGGDVPFPVCTEATRYG